MFLQIPRNTPIKFIELIVLILRNDLNRLGCEVFQECMKVRKISRSASARGVAGSGFPIDRVPPTIKQDCEHLGGMVDRHVFGVFGPEVVEAPFVERLEPRVGGGLELGTDGGQ
jgi:hypothetical protein